MKHQARIRNLKIIFRTNGREFSSLVTITAFTQPHKFDYYHNHAAVGYTCILYTTFLIYFTYFLPEKHSHLPRSLLPETKTLKYPKIIRTPPCGCQAATTVASNGNANEIQYSICLDPLKKICRGLKKYQ